MKNKNKLSAKITRKEAIKKGVKLTALTSASIIFLTSKAHAGNSQLPNVGNNFRTRPAPD